LREPFVEAAQAQHRLAAEGTEGDRVDVALACGVAESGVAHARRAGERQGDGSGHVALSRGAHQAAHMVGSRAQQEVDAPPHMIGGDHAVPVDAHQNIATGRRHPDIH